VPDVDGDSGKGLCLVTGATGFIGAALTRRLSRAGYVVRCLVRVTSDRSALADLDVQFAYGDLTDAASLIVAAEGCRYVVHCGALVSDWASVDEIREVNVEGTTNVLNAAAKASAARVVHISTTDVYGYPGTPKVDEQQIQSGFANWYSETKREAEREARRIEREANLELTILRPATVYGPGSREVVGEMAKAIVRGQMLMVDGGRPLAGLVYVDNVVDAVLLSLDDQRAAGQAFNVTDGLDVTWKQFLTDIANGLGRRTPRWSIPYWPAHTIAHGFEHGYRALHNATGLTTKALLSRQAVQVLGRSQDFSNQKIREALGWEPRTSYQAGIEATLDWLEQEYLAAPR
jgi:nucleoside-diphosphate-sugar epimerase